MSHTCQECGEPLDDDQDPDEEPLCDLCQVEARATREMWEDLERGEDENE